jgi:glycosyltransferase involved in cell wall biosynthesis
MPIISIGMPLRNSSATVAHAIESVLAQQFSDWELIIIDDGSTDGTAEAVRRFGDPRIRLVEHAGNCGLATRLNEAVRLAAGEFFARMDGDDVMYPERLRLQYEFLQLHPEIDLVGGAVLVFRGDGVRLGMRGGCRTHEEICARPWSSFPIAHPTWTGRTAWFRNHPYPEEMIRAQDQALLLRSYRSSCFATLGEIVLGYREERLTLAKVLLGRYYAMLAHLITAREYGTGHWPLPSRRRPPWWTHSPSSAGSITPYFAIAPGSYRSNRSGVGRKCGRAFLRFAASRQARGAP